jgi:hypothetical protein
MGSIAERKYHLIQLISSIENEKVLAQIQEKLEEIRRKEELIAQIKKNARCGRNETRAKLETDRS